MNAKKCDRCGRLYELYCHKKPKDMESFNSIKFTLESEFGRVSHSDLKDLCPNCKEELTEWFRGKRIVEGTCGECLLYKSKECPSSKDLGENGYCSNFEEKWGD